MDEKKRDRLRMGDIMRRLGQPDAGRPDAPVKKPDRPPGEPRPAPQEDAGDALPEQPSFGTPPARPVKPAAAAAPQTPDIAIRKLQTPAVVPPQTPAEPRPAPPPRPAAPAPSSFASDDDDEEQVDIVRYIAVILRRKNVIIAVTLIAALYAVFSYLRGQKLFVAKARLLYQPEQQNIIDDSRISWRYYVDREKAINTHLELLRSASVFDRVVENLSGQVDLATLRAGLAIKQGETAGEKNDIVEMSFSSPDAVLARDVVNELCRVYLEYRREVSSQEYTRLILKLETQIEKLDTELAQKESALRSFKETNRMVKLSDETSLVVTKLSNMELALQQTELALLETRERITSLKTHISQQENEIIQSITYDNAYQSTLSDLELQMSALSSEYSPEHYKVKMLRQQIDKIKQDMQSEMQTRAARQTTMVKNPIRQTLVQEYVQLTIESAALETKRTTHQQIIGQLKEDLLKLPAIEQQYAVLERETESQLQTLRVLKSKLEEVRIMRDSQECDLRILEVAPTPTVAITTSKPRNILIGIFVGLVLGVALAFLLEYLDQTIKDPFDVEKQLEVPLLGIVPMIENEKAIIEHAGKVSKSLIEPFRVVRANLKHYAARHDLQTLIMCSAVKGEGKTTLTVNVGLSFALDGRNVIVVDADLRRSQLHKLFNLPNEKGLADYLQGTCGVDDVIQSASGANLSIITAGHHPANPGELVGNDRFVQLLADLRARFDIVLVDSPAALPVSDALTMAPKTDGVVMVARALWTPLKAVKQARQQFSRIGCPVYGCILNGAPHSRSYYPYYYGYYGYYSYQYAYEYEEDRPRGWSLRITGNRIESAVKRWAQAMVTYLPHLTALGLRFAAYCARKPLFWILLALFAGLLLYEAWLRPPQTPPLQEGIQFMSGRQDDSGVKNADEPPITVLEPDVPAADGRAADTAAAGFSGFKDSLASWVAAFNGRDSARLCGFYDAGEFTFPDGGFAQWTANLGQTLLSARRNGGIITLDSARLEQASPPYARTAADIVLTGKSGTIRSRVVMAWRRSEAGWRIVREKKQKLE